MLRRTSIGLLLLTFFSITSCQRQNNNIPLVIVDVYININNPSYFQLQAVGGWTYVTGGSKGLIVYRYSVDEFRVYDRHSTYLPENDCIVSVDTSDNLTIEDACSGSRWIITDGSVIQGPATFPLQGYQSSFDGQIIHIYN